MDELIKQRFGECSALIGRVELVSQIANASAIIIESIKNGNAVYICGNGGSMAEAEHFAGEMVGRYKKERKGLPFTALGTDHAVMTAWANDHDYESVFARELEAKGKRGDVLVVLSTSGNSKNCIDAVKKAKEIGIKTVGLLGEGGELQTLVDVAISVLSSDTPRIQEVHLLIIHIISEIIEEAFFTNN
jgi:D-sedoheptulose 7-phosphate isomerase